MNKEIKVNMINYVTCQDISRFRSWHSRYQRTFWVRRMLGSPFRETKIVHPQHFHKMHARNSTSVIERFILVLYIVIFVAFKSPR